MGQRRQVGLVSHWSSSIHDNNPHPTPKEKNSSTSGRVLLLSDIKSTHTLKLAERMLYLMNYLTVGLCAQQDLQRVVQQHLITI